MKKYIIYWLKTTVLAFVVLFAVTGCKQTSYLQRADETDDAFYSQQEQSEDEENLSADENQSTDVKQSSKEIYVQISGAVKKPGVYKMHTGDRVYQVIDKAGGLLSQADENSINQASIVNDEQQIVVLTKEESSQIAKEEKAAESGQVQINTATEEQLMTLPGIGESRAADIIAYRTKNGNFSKIEDIMKVPGIKEGAFNKIKDQITVN